ncbi:Protein GAMETE EXPRESSED 1 [Raphanus sativus]|uniref:Protein GAMETE EXPRESSED 1 n=1 Tax=Raphanus sativus TaxID=3726 RepID=A0A6J0LAY3_RAPSA|nr:protein GAMETE EXPRESSED 1 [Raphanus sativus]XP_018456681.1 protein GAMETE EXPRESSED 1 [Raphanus sativus]XP_056849744.1 protein GAMETE EXPRESSED 1 [Raphanus sativus]KAJ4875486.1 Protein GAMETE EXPRESSED 1 [Raphanus sativus]
MVCFNRRYLLYLLIIFLVSPIKCHSWGWFSSSSSSSGENTNPSPSSRSLKSNAEFSIEVFSDQKAVQVLEDAKNKLVGPNSCWQNAYGYLMSGCKGMVATEEQRKRFAWHLSDCFQKESGRPDFPACNDKQTMMSCLKKLDDHEHKIYLEFMLETNTICQQLQSHALKNEIERLVNDLKRSAQNTEEKLDILESKSDDILHSTSKIHESVGSIDVVVNNVAHKTNTIGTQMSGLSQQTRDIYQEQKSITESQLALKEGQEKMGEAMRVGMETFNDSVTDVKEGVDRLKNDTKQIGGKINLLGEKMTEKMTALENQTSIIGTMTNSTLDNQQKLLEGQSVAIDSIQSLNQFQSEALQESRSTLQRFAEFSQEQQEDLARRQEELQKVHDHLFENSKSMLAAQEAFEAKQASMFVALDKLFALHNAMLLESRVIKAFFIYFLSIFVIYMFTSTKQTYTIRPRLYIGLCVTLALEVSSLRYVNDAEHRAWVINLVRSLFAVLASAQLLHAAFTYRDYEVLNHNILLRLVDKVNSMQRKRDLLWDEDTDSEVDWNSWIDTDITDDDDSLGDPDYRIPEQIKDNVGFTSPVTKRLYNLRPR